MCLWNLEKYSTNYKMEEKNKLWSSSDNGQGEKKKSFGPNKLISSQVAFICRGITNVEELNLFGELNGVKNHLHVIKRRKHLEKTVSTYIYIYILILFMTYHLTLV